MKLFYKKGSWDTTCDVCGFRFKADQLKKRWDGLMTCKEDWEPRHPQDYLRAIPDNQNVPWTRPEIDGPNVGPSYIYLYIDEGYYQDFPWLGDSGEYYNQSIVPNLPNIYYAAVGYWDDTYVGTSG